MQTDLSTQPHPLRPVAMLVVCCSLAVAGLLVATVSVGASPSQGQQYASLR